MSKAISSEVAQEQRPFEVEWRTIDGLKTARRPREIDLGRLALRHVSANVSSSWRPRAVPA